MAVDSGYRDEPESFDGACTGRPAPTLHARWQNLHFPGLASTPASRPRRNQWTEGYPVRMCEIRTFPLGNLRDRSKDAPIRPAPAAPPPIEDLPRILGLTNGDARAAASSKPSKR